VAAFSGPPLVHATGRIAYTSCYDDGGATLSITDLSRRYRDHASFHAPEQPESVAFNGLRSICVGDRILVQETASVIEAHPVTAPGRLPTASLPVAGIYRSPAHERPACRYH
jgi:hypothetical protein